MGNPLQEKRMYGTATVGTKGQIVIPADAREELNIKAGDRLYIVKAHQGVGFVCIKEEMLEHMMAQLTTQVENFRALKNNN